jgi:hypothetical protein
MTPVVNQHGRAWSELDSLRAQVHLQGAFRLVAADGTPLCGRHIDGQTPVRYVAPDWRLHATGN